MAPTDVQAAGAAAGWHLETPKEARTTVQIHKETREQLTAIRESINAAAGADLVTNDDVIRHALLALGRLDEVADSGPEAMTEDDADLISPLAAHIHDAADPQVLSGETRENADAGGE